jgi:predicted transcriptional regulator
MTVVGSTNGRVRYRAFCAHRSAACVVASGLHLGVAYKEVCVQTWDAMGEGLGEIPVDATLREAAQRMRLLDVSALPVCEDEEFVGIVTAEDIAMRGVADGVDPNRAKVRDVMTWQMFFFDAGC